MTNLKFNASQILSYMNKNKSEVIFNWKIVEGLKSFKVSATNKRIKYFPISCDLGLGPLTAGFPVIKFDNETVLFKPKSFGEDGKLSLNLGRFDDERSALTSLMIKMRTDFETKIQQLLKEGKVTSDSRRATEDCPLMPCSLENLFFEGSWKNTIFSRIKGPFTIMDIDDTIIKNATKDQVVSLLDPGTIISGALYPPQIIATSRSFSLSLKSKIIKIDKLSDIQTPEESLNDEGEMVYDEETGTMVTK